MSLIILSCPRDSKKGERTITLQDYRALRHYLLSDPKSVLDLFAECNLTYLSDFGQWWDKLCEDEPERTQDIIGMAAQMGIAEKPPKRKRFTTACSPSLKSGSRRK